MREEEIVAYIAQEEPVSPSVSAPSASVEKRKSVAALEWTNFFLADVQTGLGPFVAAYLAANGWRPDRVGYALTLAGMATVMLQTPAGWLVDRIEGKRLLLIAGVVVLACGAFLLGFSSAAASVYAAQVLIGSCAAFLAPTLAAITMGIVGIAAFDRQFGRNQGFNAAGNLVAAAVVAIVSHLLGNRAIFFALVLLSIPTIVSILSIRRSHIDFDLARGGSQSHDRSNNLGKTGRRLLRDRILWVFLLCCFLFHLANAAMLPQLGELLARGSAKAAAPFMSGCIAVTQVVITLSAAWVGRMAHRFGRKPLLLVGFGVLPVRALLYTVLHGTAALLSVQFLDGVANVVFVVVSILVVADYTKGTGHFNLVQGMMATAVGLGAALSATVGGSLIAQAGFSASFLSLGGIALAAFLLLWLALPETLSRQIAGESR